MSSLLHLNISAFPMILLAVILVSLRRRTIQSTDNRLFASLVEFTFLLLASELLSWTIDGVSFPLAFWLNWITNIIYFLLVPFVSVLWVNYMYFRVEKKLILSASSGKRCLMLLPVAIFYLLLLSSPATGWIFTVNAHNTYARGPLFYLTNAICIFYMLFSLLIALRTVLSGKAGYRRKQVLSLAFFSTIPIVAAILQAIFSGIWITLPCTAVAELLMYMYLQRLSIKKDALTGINNRGCLDAYLNAQLEQAGRRRSLCLFMLDLDYFKHINDTYGHDVGDDALKRAAGILTGLIHNTDAFLARYGGDEFCIVDRCDSLEEADAMAARIKDAFAKADREQRQVYTLSCSIGYSLLEKDSHACPEAIIRQADTMLLQNKKRRDIA